MAPGFSHGFSARPGPKEMQVLDGLDHFSLFKPLAKATTGETHSSRCGWCLNYWTMLKYLKYVLEILYDIVGLIRVLPKKRESVGLCKNSWCWIHGIWFDQQKWDVLNINQLKRLKTKIGRWKAFLETPLSLYVGRLRPWWACTSKEVCLKYSQLVKVVYDF
jgi:hypothetical protein